MFEVVDCVRIEGELVKSRRVSKLSLWSSNNIPLSANQVSVVFVSIVIVLFFDSRIISWMLLSGVFL